MRALARTSKNNSIRSGRMGGLGGAGDNSISMRSNRNKEGVGLRPTSLS